MIIKLTAYCDLFLMQVTERSEVACGLQITEYMSLTRSQVTERSKVACGCYKKL